MIPKNSDQKASQKSLYFLRAKKVFFEKKKMANIEIGSGYDGLLLIQENKMMIKVSDQAAKSTWNKYYTIAFSTDGNTLSGKILTWAKFSKTFFSKFWDVTL